MGLGFEPEGSLEMDGGCDRGLESLVDSLAEKEGLHVVDLQKDGLEEFRHGEDFVFGGRHDGGIVLCMM